MEIPSLHYKYVLSRASKVYSFLKKKNRHLSASAEIGAETCAQVGAPLNRESMTKRKTPDSPTKLRDKML